MAISHATIAAMTPTNIQNPQLMFPPVKFLRTAPRSDTGSVVVLLDHDRSRELVMPALLALVEGDPDEPEHEDRRHEVGEVAPDQLARRRGAEGRGVDDFGGHEHLSRGRAAEAPEKNRRHRGQHDLHKDVE